MSDSRTQDPIVRELREAARTLELPPTPALVGAVQARLMAESAAGRRPPLPGRALWTPRRALALATVAVLALLALAAAGRLVLGAAEIRVQPGVSPTGPPLRPPELGEPVPLEDLSTRVGFPVALPEGPPPDAGYAIETDWGSLGALLVWRAQDEAERLPGTPWARILMQLETDRAIALKSVGAFEDVREVRVEGRRAYWIDAPHTLVIRTATGEERLSVQGNVLIWVERGITFRLETTLELGPAVAMADSFA